MYGVMKWWQKDNKDDMWLCLWSSLVMWWLCCKFVQTHAQNIRLVNQSRSQSLAYVTTSSTWYQYIRLIWWMQDCEQTGPSRALFGGTFFPLPNVRSWLQCEKPKSCKKKCSKWVYIKWILEYLELNETYLLFGRNNQNSHLILTLLDFHTDHTALKKCSAISAKKQVGLIQFYVL